VSFQFSTEDRNELLEAFSKHLGDDASVELIALLAGYEEDFRVACERQAAENTLWRRVRREHRRRLAECLGHGTALLAALDSLDANLPAGSSLWEQPPLSILRAEFQELVDRLRVEALRWRGSRGPIRDSVRSELHNAVGEELRAACIPITVYRDGALAIALRVVTRAFSGSCEGCDDNTWARRVQKHLDDDFRDRFGCEPRVSVEEEQSIARGEAPRALHPEARRLLGRGVARRQARHLAEAIARSDQGAAVSARLRPRPARPGRHLLRCRPAPVGAPRRQEGSDHEEGAAAVGDRAGRMTAAEAKARRWGGLLRYRERLFARRLAGLHGRRFVVDALQKTLAKPCGRLEAALALEALQELGAKPAAPPRVRSGRTYTGGPPVVVLAIARTWAAKTAG
jgi:hypothetical protein